MIDKEQAFTLRHGTELHAGECKCIVGPRGGLTLQIEAWRISGKVKTWITRPDNFEVPVKHGLYVNGTMHQANGHLFHLASDCPAIKQYHAALQEKQHATP